MKKIAICGRGGRMGSRIAALLKEEKGFSLYGGVEHSGSELLQNPPSGEKIVSDLKQIVSEVDVVIDFSQPEGTLHYLPLLIDAKKPVVIGTTGFDLHQKTLIEQASHHIPICFSPNMSVGVNVLFKLVSEAAKLLSEDYDVEVIEAHHRLKKDAPSGTALKIAEVLLQALNRSKSDLVFHREGITGERKEREIGMQTIRGGDIVGEHTVYFAGAGERIEITHRATNRDNFAKGAILAAKWLIGKGPGLYEMKDVLGL